MNTHSPLIRLCLIAIVVVCSAAGCSRSAARQAGKAPPPVAVDIVTVAEQAVPIATQLPGRTSAYQVAEVRPQVTGVILKRLFTEGAEVRAGEALYQIDPAPFEAALDNATASLNRAKALATSSRLLAERNKPLADARAVSQQDYDNAVAASEQAAADVAAAEASLRTARINLAYTRVLSPIQGRTGRSSVTVGALVTANQALALVTVQQLDPIYVDVTQASALMLHLRREVDEGRLTGATGGAAAVSLTLEDGSDYGMAGQLQFSEVVVDQATGAVTLRARFPNPRGILLPGMFVHATIQEGMRQAFLIPQQGVTHSPTGESTAMVIGAKDAAEVRVLQAERTQGDRWLVTAGLRSGDRVIVAGGQNVRPGLPLIIRDVSKPDPPATAATDAAPSPRT